MGDSASIIDVIERWFISSRESFDLAGIRCRFERSPANRPNASCSLTLQCRTIEADLVAWESGEAELAAGEVGGAVTQKHYGDLRNPDDLKGVLAEMISVLRADN